MRLWLERFIIPICAAIVISLSILNPLKMDWRQRVSLAVAVSFFAYFVAHTLHRTAAASDPNEEMKASLRVQQQELDSLKQQLAANHAQEEEKRKRRREIRNQLGVFLDEGKRIQHDIEYNNPVAVHAKSEWEQRVEKYLAKELDSSWAARFRTPFRALVTYPEGMNMKQAVPWTDVTEKIGALNTFISELRD